uniref:F-box domain-containing protein n=1 Tax=Aegilops tauschii subsp. strangulata TaxID=200361 RepID=A0A452YL40_AEGTS
MGQKGRRRQNLARNGVNRRKDSLYQQVGGGDSQNGETLTYSMPYLPEDIWHRIHSLMPMRDAARAACLSRAFLHSWRCHPNLTLDWQTLCSKSKGGGGNFSRKIDSIIRNHSGIGLKRLELDIFDDDRTLPYIDSWLQFAVTPGIEELTLGLYKSAFRPMAELGPLRSLTTLHLCSVRITGDEVGCFLSNSPALEQLKLYDCKEIIFLKIPCMLQRLRCLSVFSCWMLQLIECKAPNLSNIYASGENIKLSLSEALCMKDLCMCFPNVIGYALAELPSIMPTLETLEIGSEDEVVNTPMLPTKFIHLKHLNIQITESDDYFHLASFLDASPSLETLFLDVSKDKEYVDRESVFGGSSLHLRQLPEDRHVRLKLKRVEIIGFSSAKSLVSSHVALSRRQSHLSCLCWTPLMVVIGVVVNISVGPLARLFSRKISVGPLARLFSRKPLERSWL